MQANDISIVVEDILDLEMSKEDYYVICRGCALNKPCYNWYCVLDCVYSKAFDRQYQVVRTVLPSRPVLSPLCPLCGKKESRCQCDPVGKQQFLNSIGGTNG